MFEKMKQGDFDQVFEIMKESFPLDEYRPYEGQKAILQNSNYEIYCNYGDDNKVKAFITLYNIGDFLFAEHFAVSKNQRNCGMGSKILSALKEIAKDRQIVLEVELPNGEMERRRVGFYERNGFSFNEFDYIQPPIWQGRNEIPLKLMTTKGKVDKDRFNYMKNLIFSEVYHKNDNM